MCGVLVVFSQPLVHLSGSSPHVRGFASVLPFSHSQIGFIPACAGFCDPVRQDRPADGVHPRMCGVLQRFGHLRDAEQGSSPHVRGFASAPDWLKPFSRFIPACAGFCTCALSSTTSMWVHPRMCGVLRSAIRGRRGSSGSSPHVRGFVVVPGAHKDRVRFIPACAGFCVARFGAVEGHRVHPRMCGVLVAGGANLFRAVGSSPHVRGFAARVRSLASCSGFIPACAGF